MRANLSDMGAGPVVKTPGSASLWRHALRRFRKNRTAVIGLVLLVILSVAAIFAPWITAYDPLARDYRDRLKPPSVMHPLGTDYLGRDLLTRIIFGARVSLTVGIAAVGLALVVGTFLGGVAGYFGGLADLLIMRVIDVMLAFPSILLAIGIVAVLGPHLMNALIAVSVVTIPIFARIVRSSVLSVRAHEFVEAAHALGSRHARILVRHVLPNCAAPIIVQGTLGIATAILDVAGLSFLGLGAQPPAPEWGAMLADAQRYLRTAPWLVSFPGIAIVTAVLAFNLVGDGLRDALDPKLRR